MAAVQTPSGKTEREDEVVIYAKINNFDGLQYAQSKESHEQWQVNAPYGKIRVRKTSKEGLMPSFSMAIKTRDSEAGIAGGTETPMEITQDVFEAFKLIANQGMIKDRYTFQASKVSVTGDAGKESLPDAGLVFEVDVYPKQDGSGYHEYCKIDLEINKMIDALALKGKGNVKLNIKVTDLAFQPSEVILGTTDKLEEKARISQLYDTVFLAKRGAPAAPEQSPVNNVALSSEPASEDENVESPGNEQTDATAVAPASEEAPVVEELREDLTGRPPKAAPSGVTRFFTKDDARKAAQS